MKMSILHGTLFFILSILTSNAASAPNILFILVDDLGWGNIGFNSPTNPEIQTPNINHLATKEGLILNRHYVHYCCSPTRTAMQSGRLPVHVNMNNAGPAANPHSGAPINMTIIAEKLKYSQHNYSTHFIGKWDAGSATMEQTPHGRGYDTSFGYLSHANTWFKNYGWNHPCDRTYGFDIYDLWDTDQPAYDAVDDGVYEEFKFAERVYKLLDDHDNTANTADHDLDDGDDGERKKKKPNPFFIVYASHLAHDPLQIDKDYYKVHEDDENLCSANDPFIYPGFNDSNSFHCRSVVQSMVNLLDVIVGNITRKLKERNLWENTLIIFTGDNGGCQRLDICGGNSHPLRGGKFVPFEGGIRTTTFVSGGYLPSHRYGETENGMIHIVDWYTTFCEMNGIDATDYKALKAGLPPIDGVNVWDLVRGMNATSPRTEIAVDDHVLIQNEYKLIVNTTLNYAGWSGLIFPNGSSVDHPVEEVKLQCDDGCLFDVVHDMTEHHNVIQEKEEIAHQMNERLVELKKGYYSNDEQGVDLCPEGVNMSCGCWMAKNRYNGFYGPYQRVP